MGEGAKEESRYGVCARVGRWGGPLGGENRAGRGGSKGRLGDSARGGRGLEGAEEALWSIHVIAADARARWSGALLEAIFF